MQRVGKSERLTATRTVQATASPNGHKPEMDLTGVIMWILKQPPNIRQVVAAVAV